MGLAEFGTQQELQLLALLVSAAALLILAGPLRIPYPILLVLGGLLLGFGPGRAEGDDAAGGRARSASCRRSSTCRRTSPGCASCGRTCGRSRCSPSGSSRMTTVGVAVVAHAIADLAWAEAFVLGAVVSPTDPIAATAIGRRLGVPRRLIDIIEGESLVNDGTALVLLRTAIVAAVAGSFSPWDAGGRLVLNIVGGIAVGLAVGYVDPPRPARARQPAARGDDRLPHRLLRVPAGGGARRLGRARGRHRRRLHGLVHARADDRADAPAGPAGSGRS